MDYANPPNANEKPELPQWRVELSRRLQEIKQKREAGFAVGPGESGNKPRVLAGTERSPREEEIKEALAKSDITRASRRPPRAVRPATPPVIAAKKPSPKSAPTAQDTVELPLFQSVESGEPRPPADAADAALRKNRDTDSTDVRSLIDSIVSRHPAAEASIATAPPSSTSAVPGVVEDRLILVSRTLSGLVDLLVVTLCTVSFIMAADIASGIDIFDSGSLIICFLLLLTIYFVYSTFFLGTANQTIGMMLTELRLVDSEERRPRIRQILWHCFGYLVSLFILGAGLLWGCFDRNCRCLHDRLSDTRVVRL